MRVQGWRDACVYVDRYVVGVKGEEIFVWMWGVERCVCKCRVEDIRMCMWV